MSQIDQARDAQSNTRTTEPLILQHYAEIARYAVQLAKQKLTGIICSSFHAAVGCDVCQSIWDRSEPPMHDDSCIVGRVFRLAAEIATLQASATDRTIEYFAHSTPVGEFVPARIVTHEMAARA
jgi:hypothetical protein